MTAIGNFHQVNDATCNFGIFNSLQTATTSGISKFKERRE